MPPITPLIALYLSYPPLAARAATDPTLSSLCCDHTRTLLSPGRGTSECLCGPTVGWQTSGAMTQYARTKCSFSPLSPAYLVRQLRAK